MVPASPRSGFTDSTLTRLLARLSGPAATDPRASRHSAADRLSEWTSWTAAISLSAALSGAAAAGAPNASPGRRGTTPANERLAAECRSVHGALARSIADFALEDTDGGGEGQQRRPQPSQPTPSPARAADADADADADASVDGAAPPAIFKPHRQRYLARQQALEAGLGALRERLRSALAARSPALARLAAVDLVMAQVLDGRERQLLAAVPQVLEKHFLRLRDQAAAEGAPDAQWLGVFRQDAREALQAELDFRFQPIEGLLEALRTSPQTGQLR